MIYNKNKFRKYFKEYFLKKYKTDENFRKKHREYLRKSAKKRRGIMKKLRKDYPEYDKAIKEYLRNAFAYGKKKAYKIYKQKILELRKKHNINFPISL